MLTTSRPQLRWGAVSFATRRQLLLVGLRRAPSRGLAPRRQRLGVRAEAAEQAGAVPDSIPESVLADLTDQLVVRWAGRAGGCGRRLVLGCGA